MESEKLSIKTKLQVIKPVDEVFRAVIDPAQMTNYFIASSTGPMESGKELIWRFPEFDADVPVRTGSVEKNKYLSFYWDAENGKELLVEMHFTSRGSDKTLVTITEKDMVNNEAGIKWLKQNTEGWANFMACLKAWVEHGINLRKGAFDFMKS